MKDEEKKVNEEVQTEEEGVELTDEQLSQVSGGAPRQDPELPVTHLVVE